MACNDHDRSRSSNQGLQSQQQHGYPDTQSLSNWHAQQTVNGVQHGGSWRPAYGVHHPHNFQTYNHHSNFQQGVWPTYPSPRSATGGYFPPNRYTMLRAGIFGPGVQACVHPWNAFPRESVATTQWAPRQYHYSHEGYHAEPNWSHNPVYNHQQPAFYEHSGFSTQYGAHHDHRNLSAQHDIVKPDKYRPTYAPETGSDRRALVASMPGPPGRQIQSSRHTDPLTSYVQRAKAFEEVNDRWPTSQDSIETREESPLFGQQPSNTFKCHHLAKHIPRHAESTDTIDCKVQQELASVEKIRQHESQPVEHIMDDQHANEQHTDNSEDLGLVSSPAQANIKKIPRVQMDGAASSSPLDAAQCPEQKFTNPVDQQNRRASASPVPPATHSDPRSTTSTTSAPSKGAEQVSEPISIANSPKKPSRPTGAAWANFYTHIQQNDKERVNKAKQSLEIQGMASRPAIRETYLDREGKVKTVVHGEVEKCDGESGVADLAEKDG